MHHVHGRDSDVSLRDSIGTQVDLMVNKEGAGWAHHTRTSRTAKARTSLPTGKQMGLGPAPNLTPASGGSLA